MNHWRCGRAEDAHPDWCSDGTPNDCTHCGGNPCRWWCEGADDSRQLDNPGRFQPGMYRNGRSRVMEPA